MAAKTNLGVTVPAALKTGIPPNKEQRQLCYNNRDNYFKCLDKENNVMEKCEDLRAQFEKACPKPWIKHFESKRMRDKLKESYGQAPELPRLK